MIRFLAHFGAVMIQAVEDFGDFCRFTGQTLLWLLGGARRTRNLRLLLPQLYEIGTRSIPVVIVTGLFVGMVLAVQVMPQFKAMGLMARMGLVINLSVLRELGPVLGGVMLAGRVGGGLTAELGTMRVTEQLEALRAMGASPIRVLVVPRVLACVLLTPLLVVYANLMGIIGGYGICATIFDVNSAEFWRNAAEGVRHFDIFYGLFKAVFFGAALGLISCYKGFRCSAGAAGVGRACTQGFVTCCMAILILNLFVGIFLNTIEDMYFSARSVF